jgi:hypothetical protein
LEHGGERDGEPDGEVGGGPRSCGQPVEHRPPGRIGEGLESQVESRVMVKHAL